MLEFLFVRIKKTWMGVAGDSHQAQRKRAKRQSLVWPNLLYSAANEKSSGVGASLKQLACARQVTFSVIKIERRVYKANANGHRCGSSRAVEQLLPICRAGAMRVLSGIQLSEPGSARLRRSPSVEPHVD